MKDTYGNDHDLKPHNIIVMMAVGWACFLGSWLINIAYYKFHPSAVDVFDLSEKKKLYVFGKDVLSSETNKSILHSDMEGEFDYIFCRNIVALNISYYSRDRDGDGESD